MTGFFLLKKLNMQSISISASYIICVSISLTIGIVLGNVAVVGEMILWRMNNQLSIDQF